MKIEKINESQIRCILTKSELEMRDLKLSEIAYGTTKVKKLFQDMMQLAYVQCGFEAENIPLAIEVVPFKDYASITVTKVEDPEELDTRYSRFAPNVEAKGGLLSELDKLFRSITSGIPMPVGDDIPLPDSSEEDSAGGENEVSMGSVTFKEAANRYFYFDCIEDLFALSSVIGRSVAVKSNLYKSRNRRDEGTYLLEIVKDGMSEQDFKDVCTLASEYGSLASTVETFPYYVTEHYDIMMKEDALSCLMAV